MKKIKTLASEFRSFLQRIFSDELEKTALMQELLTPVNLDLMHLPDAEFENLCSELSKEIKGSIRRFYYLFSEKFLSLYQIAHHHAFRHELVDPEISILEVKKIHSEDEMAVFLVRFVCRYYTDEKCLCSDAHYKESRSYRVQVRYKDLKKPKKH